MEKSKSVSKRKEEEEKIKNSAAELKDIKTFYNHLKFLFKKSLRSFVIIYF